jgi:hypothetical protein
MIVNHSAIIDLGTAVQQTLHYLFVTGNVEVTNEFLLKLAEIALEGKVPMYEQGV